MKKHLATFRSGWQSENLARYILSNFAFISQPSTIADDIGSDFICTIFEVLSDGKKEYLSPKESFAIQIKSNARKFSISNKKSYLKGLQIPFFVGVIKKKRKELDLYSGEYLIPFFVDNPDAEKIKIKLSAVNKVKVFEYSENSEEYTVGFRKCLTISSNRDSHDFASNIQKLSKICRAIAGNIARLNNNQFIFYDSFNWEFHMVNRDNLIESSFSKRLSTIAVELSFVLENRLIENKKDEYEAVRNAIYRAI